MNSGLIFLDEAHHAMTPSRVETIHKAFAHKAIRIALTATQDYNRHKPPILPIDLLLPPGEDYSCGELLQTAPGVDQVRIKVHLTPKNPVRAVRLQSRILASTSLVTPLLDPADKEQIRQVLVSGLRR